MDAALWIELAVFVALLGFSGFFSSSQTSLFSLSSFQLDRMRSARHPRIGLIERLRSELRRLIVTILLIRPRGSSLTLLRRSGNASKKRRAGTRRSQVGTTAIRPSRSA